MWDCQTKWTQGGRNRVSNQDLFPERKERHKLVVWGQEKRPWLPAGDLQGLLFWDLFLSQWNVPSVPLKLGKKGMFLVHPSSILLPNYNASKLNKDTSYGLQCTPWASLRRRGSCLPSTCWVGLGRALQHRCHRTGVTEYTQRCDDTLHSLHSIDLKSGNPAHLCLYAYIKAQVEKKKQSNKNLENHIFNRHEICGQTCRKTYLMASPRIWGLSCSDAELCV